MTEGGSSAGPSYRDEEVMHICGTTGLQDRFPVRFPVSSLMLHEGAGANQTRADSTAVYSGISTDYVINPTNEIQSTSDIDIADTGSVPPFSIAQPGGLNAFAGHPGHSASHSQRPTKCVVNDFGWRLRRVSDGDDAGSQDCRRFHFPVRRRVQPSF